MDKRDTYNRLVQKRKMCHICKGLTNPAACEGGKYDSCEIGPWTLWQGNLDAEIMIVGQDWGDEAYFTKWKGIDQPTGNPTDSNLQELLRQFSTDIKGPREPQEQKIFLTNLILCLKEGGLQASIKKEWLTSCCENFFCPLLYIVRPKVVMSLGKRVAEAILDLYRIPYRKTWKLHELMQRGPFHLIGHTYLFPVYHCGASGVNRNRLLADQKLDWERAAKWVKANLVQTRASTHLGGRMKSVLLISLLLALNVIPVSAKDPIRVMEGIVSKVSDGDTVQVQDTLGSKVKVRLYGIDAPETEKRNRKTGRISKPGQPLGEEAFQTLKGKIGGQRVMVEVRDIDRYRRMVSVVRLEGRDINQEMVREGYAWAYRRYLERPYASEYIGAEEEARRERRGLWRQGNPVPPWEFRKGLKSER